MLSSVGGLIALKRTPGLVLESTSILETHSTLEPAMKVNSWFQAFAFKWVNLCRYAAAENVYHACNCDGNGELNHREFVGCLKALGYALDHESNVVLFRSLCASNGAGAGATTTAAGGVGAAEAGAAAGGLSLEAFTRYVCSKPIRSVVSAGDCLLVRKVFDSFDADRSNMLSRDEMENCVVGAYHMLTIVHVFLSCCKAS
jgi:hypothetical protein